MQRVFAWHILFKDFLPLSWRRGKTAVARATNSRTDGLTFQQQPRSFVNETEAVHRVIETTGAVINKTADVINKTTNEKIGIAPRGITVRLNELNVATIKRGGDTREFYF